jgi:hypothetical protein
MVSGVDPTKRLFTNTRAPEGRDCTLILPTPVAIAGPLEAGALALRDGADRSEKLIAAIARSRVNCTRRSSGA